MIRSALPALLLLLTPFALRAQSPQSVPTTITAMAQSPSYPNQDYPSSPTTRIIQHAPTTESSNEVVIVHQADELCERIGLPQGQVREKVTAYVQTLLPGTGPRRQLVTLSELLRTHTRGFQVLLAPMMPQPNYDSYVALLNNLNVRATE